MTYGGNWDVLTQRSGESDSTGAFVLPEAGRSAAERSCDLTRRPRFLMSTKRCAWYTSPSSAATRIDANGRFLAPAACSAWARLRDPLVRARGGELQETGTLDGEAPCRRRRLSFAKLIGLLPRRDARRFEAELEEPWDLVVEPARQLKDGSRELTYKFQLSAFEPEDLIIRVSRLYPHLYFIIGCVAPSVDAQSSLLVHNGQSWQWRLPVRRKNAIWNKLAHGKTDDNSDELTWGLAEADWQMIDEVVEHWRLKVDTLMGRALKKGRVARSHCPVTHSGKHMR